MLREESCFRTSNRLPVIKARSLRADTVGSDLDKLDIGRSAREWRLAGKMFNVVREARNLRGRAGNVDPNGRAAVSQP